MPLQLPDPPAGLPDTIRSGVRKLAGRPQISTEALRRARPHEVDVSTPHQIFTMGLDDLVAGRGLDSARPVGWRYVVEAAGQPIASAETTLAADGTTHLLSDINEGPFVGATADAVRSLHARRELQAGVLELRLLRIPALYVMALWLHSAATDLLVPLAPSPVGREGQLVPAAELITELATRARSVKPLARPDEPGPTAS